MGLGAGGYEQVEVGQVRRAQARLARLRRVAQRVDRLPGTIVARPRHPEPRGVPQLADRAFLADHHPRTGAGRRVGEIRAAAAGGNDVGADVAQGLQPPSGGDGREATEPAPRNVLEEDALDRLLRAEGEHLVERRSESFRHGRIVPPG